MEYLEGDTLAGVLATRRLPMDRVVGHGITIASARQKVGARRGTNRNGHSDGVIPGCPHDPARGRSGTAPCERKRRSATCDLPKRAGQVYAEVFIFSPVCGSNGYAAHPGPA